VLSCLMRAAALRCARATITRGRGLTRRAAATTLSFDPSPPADAPTTCVVGLKDRLKALESPPAPDVWEALVDSCSPGDAGASATTATPSGDGLSKIVAACLPDHCSRHNSPLRPKALTKLVGAACGGKKDASV